MTLTPAYGRDYKSKKAVVADFEANKDFIINDISDRYCGKPINAEQLDAGTRVALRYDRLRKIVFVSVPEVK